MKTQRLTTKDGTLSAADLDKQIKATNKQINHKNQLIAKIDQEAVARSKLSGLAKEQAEIVSKYNSAALTQQDKLNAAADASAKKAASGVEEIKAVQQAYNQLTNAYRQYNAAAKNGNEAGKAYWSQSAE